MTLATSNPNKIREFEEIKKIFDPENNIPISFEVSKNYSDVHEIQHENVETVALNKMIEIIKKNPGKNILCEDSGMYSKNLFESNSVYVPGPFIKFYGNNGNWSTLFQMFKGHRMVSNCAITINYNGSNMTFYGEQEGQIVQPRGENGFDWDPYFEIDLGNNVYETYAEMDKMKKLSVLGLSILSAFSLSSSSIAASSSSDVDPVDAIYRSAMTQQRQVQKGDKMPVVTYHSWDDYTLGKNPPAKRLSTEEFVKGVVTFVVVPRFLSPTCGKQICSFPTGKPPYEGLTVFIAEGDSDSATRQAKEAFPGGVPSNVKFIAVSTKLPSESLINKLGVYVYADETKSNGHRFSSYGHRSAFGFINGRLVWARYEKDIGNTEETALTKLAEVWETYHTLGEGFTFSNPHPFLSKL